MGPRNSCVVMLASHARTSATVDLTNVAEAMCGGYACVARKHDNTAVAWGNSAYGGDAGTVDLTNIASAEVLTPSPTAVQLAVDRSCCTASWSFRLGWMTTLNALFQASTRLIC